MQPAYDLIRRAPERHAHYGPIWLSLLVRRILPELVCLRPAKARHLLVSFLIGISLAAAPGYAHKSDFLPVGWSGPWYDGSTGQYHPERLCGLYYPSYACLVGSTSVPIAPPFPLVRWPLWVRNNQGLNTRYCTNDRDTKGWIVVIGQTGLTWAFTPSLMPQDISACNTPTRCQYFVPGTANGWAPLPWNSSGGTYYQATNHGMYCWY